MRGLCGILCLSLAAYGKARVAVQSNVSYGQGLVCPKNVSTCAWGVAAPSGLVAQHLLLDVYMPAHDRDELRAAMVIVHGGAYWTGDKLDAPIVRRANFFAAHGFVTFTVNYRLTGDQGLVPLHWPDTFRDNMTWIPKYAYPAVRDSKAAVRWVRANAARYGIDTGKRLAVDQ